MPQPETRPLTIADGVTSHLHLSLTTNNMTDLIYVAIKTFYGNSVVKLDAVIDSAATSNFISKNFVLSLNLKPLDRYSPRVIAADSREISPAGNNYWHYFTFSTYDNLPSTHCFRAIETPHKVILGLPWLYAVNPIIDWRGKTVKITESIEAATAEHFYEEAQGNAIYACYTGEDLGRAIPASYADFADVFNEAADEILPPHRGDLDHAIELLPGTSPPFGPLYNLSEQELQSLKTYLDRNMATQYINRSKSSAGAPILFVKKKDGSLRLCVDYRGLNAISIRDKYPIPLVSEILDRLSQAKIFTKLDLRGAYNLIRIRKGDEWKTAFRTRYGSFEYNVMPFGLANAPATFQSYIDRALHGLLDDFVIVYLDDILIYSEEIGQHENHVRATLARLRDSGLFVKLEKCTFGEESVEYLGFIISPQGLNMDKTRVSTVQDWPLPCSVKDIQAFLGFCNFYRRFIHNYSKIAFPMTQLTRNKTPFEWSEAAERSFTDLKQAFCDAPLLAQFNYKEPTYLETDASEFAMGGILTQKAPDTHRHPVAFFSRKFTAAERNYGTPDQELLAIVACFKNWRHYLEGAQHTVTVITDHNNLRYFLEKKPLSRRQAHWAEFLAGFDFKIEYRPGKRNPADGPSRRSDYKLQGPETYTLTPFLRLAALSFCITGETGEGDVTDEQEEDALLSHTIVDEIRSILEETRFGRDQVEETDLTWRDGLLYLGEQLYVPDNDPLRLRILRSFHDSPTAGHLGRDKTISSIQRWFFWPAMKQFIAEYVKTCDICARTKTPREARHGELFSLPAPNRPWSHITIDFVTGLPESCYAAEAKKYNAIMVVVDRFTKMAHYIATTKELNAQGFARLLLREVVRHHHMPENIVSDRGPVFRSEFWATLSKLLGTDHRLSTSFHPQTDGQTERQNQMLEHYLRCYIDYLQNDWADHLALAEHTYNAAVHSVTKISPFKAYTGRDPIPFQLHQLHVRRAGLPAKEMAYEIVKLQERLAEKISEAQDAQAKYYDRGHKRVVFKVGDLVWKRATHLRTDRPSKKLDYRRVGPFKIKSVVNEQAYTLELGQNMKFHPTCHVSLLDRYHRNTIPGRTQEPPPPITVEDDAEGHEEYEVEAVLGSRLHRGALQYLVQWKGYTGPDATQWCHAADVSAAELVSTFHERHPTMPRSL